MSEPQFSGQTKERLGSRQSASFVSTVVKDKFSLWLNHHTDLGELLAEMAIESARSRLKASKKVTRKKITSGPALPGKLSDCVSQDQEQTELFLVEGDSAGGSAKQARDRQTQAVMPLRGKILNTWEVDSSAILGSKEVHDIAVAIGVDPGVRDVNGLRYGKICILADADSDGAHIATLLCALFLNISGPWSSKAESMSPCRRSIASMWPKKSTTPSTRWKKMPSSSASANRKSEPKSMSSALRVLVR
jgi:topoisomerase-4 subunit B